MSRKLSSIPARWVVQRGEEITSKITKGVSPRWQGFGYQDDGVLFITSENVRSGFLDISHPKFVSSEFHSKLRNSQLEAGDILVNIVGASIGRACMYSGEYAEANINQAVALFRTRPTVDPIYVLNHLLFSATTAKLLQTQSETARPNLSLTDLRRFRFALPPLPEQRRIAAILGTWDQAIALTERRIGAARQRKKGLMQRLLTGRVRFPEFAGDNWREVRLGKVFTERKERGFEDLPLLSVTADEGIVYRDELNRRDTSSADKSKYLRVCKGDIVYNTMRMWQGRSGISRLEGIVSPAYTVCKPKPSADPGFMGYLFQLPSVVYLFRRYSQGLVSDTWNLKFRHFAQIHIRVPELREQRRIAAVLQTCDREIELLTQKRDALQRQKKGLMQRLLTGRVRVRV